MSEKYCVICNETKHTELTERKGQIMCDECAERYDILKQKKIDESLQLLIDDEGE